MKRKASGWRWGGAVSQGGKVLISYNWETKFFFNFLAQPANHKKFYFLNLVFELWLSWRQRNYFLVLLWQPMYFLTVWAIQLFSSSFSPKASSFRAVLCPLLLLLSCTMSTKSFFKIKAAATMSIMFKNKISQDYITTFKDNSHN